MHDVKCVAMIDSLEKALNISCRLLLSESCILTLTDLFIEGDTCDVLHDQEYLVVVVVGFVVLDNIGVVESVQSRDLVQNILKIVSKLGFIQNFNGDLLAGIKLVL